MQADVNLLGGFSLDVCDTDEPNIRHIHLFVTACRDTQQQQWIKAGVADPCNMDLPPTHGHKEIGWNKLYESMFRLWQLADSQPYAYIGLRLPRAGDGSEQAMGVSKRWGSS